MTRDQAVVLIKQQLGMRQTLADEIVLNLQLAQTMLEQGPVKPFFMVSERSVVSLTVGDQRIPLPTDFICEMDEEGLTYIPDDTSEVEVQLRKDTFDVLKNNFKNEEAGSPKAYALVGEYFRIFPTPDEAYNVRMIYYQQQATLDSNVENGWLKWCPYVIMGTTLKQIASAVRDKTAMAQGDSWVSLGYQTLDRLNVARDMANASVQVGGPHV